MSISQGRLGCAAFHFPGKKCLREAPVAHDRLRRNFEDRRGLLHDEQYVMNEVVPLMRNYNQNPHLSSVGCSFGGYHAANIAFRHPHVFRAMLSMAGAFNPVSFLNGYYDQDCYFHLPMHYLPNLNDHSVLEQMRRNTYVLATGVHDQCWNGNEQLAGVMRSKAIPVRLDVWGDDTGHDWPWWQRMLQTYV